VTFHLAIRLIWDIWLASWVIASFWSYRIARSPGFGEGALHWTLTAAGLALVVAIWSNAGWLTASLWPVGAGFGWTMAAMTAVGFAFAWWARLHLGPFWSASVGRKADHKVIDTGPYALARHPIYTGLIIASWATGAAHGAAGGAIGAALVTGGLYLKARLEERFLRAELGAAYEQYRRRTPMLIPFPRR
jgi:protein-S-isoprenylcysteine O-methyltransferase Ste14